MRPTNIQAIATDPRQFRAALVIETASGPRRLADQLDPWQQRDFAALDPAWRKIAGHKVEHVPHWRAWWERPRGHSKTQDAATMALWALAFGVRRVDGVACAVDREQAQFILRTIERILYLNPWLAAAVDVSAWKITNKRTGGALAILSSDAPSSWGLLIDFAICDEVSMWPNDELWSSLFSAVAKKQNALLLAALNAGFQDSWAFDFRQKIARDSAWYFHALSGCCASWISRERLAEQERLLPSQVYSRVWGNEWVSGAGDGIDCESLERAITLAGPHAEPQPNFSYVFGLDLGLRRDSTALCVIARDRKSNRCELAELRTWTPRPNAEVKVSDVEQAIHELHKRYQFRGGLADPWEGRFLCQRLQAARVPVDAYSLNDSSWDALARHFINSFAEGDVSLYDHGLLLRELRTTRVVEKQNGKLRLSWPRTENSHGDAACSLALGLLAARDVRPQIASVDLAKVDERAIIDLRSRLESAWRLGESRWRHADFRKQ